MTKARTYDYEGKLVAPGTFEVFCDKCGKKIKDCFNWVRKGDQLLDVCKMCVIELQTKGDTMKKETKEKAKNAIEKAKVITTTKEGSRKPTGIEIEGTVIKASSWREALMGALNHLVKRNAENFKALVTAFPNYIKEGVHTFRAPKKLEGCNGFVENNLSSGAIQSLIFKSSATLGLDPEKVRFVFK